MEEKIEIPLSKIKIALLFIGAMIFVFLGVLFLNDPEAWTSTRNKSPELTTIIGIIAIIFFGTIGAIIGRKLLDNRAGLIIDDRGITDNTNATSTGLIAWRDIEGITKLEIASNKILILKVKNPNHYIERAKNSLAKRAMKANHKMYGSPISIISNSLKIKFKDLEHLIKTELEKRKTENDLR